jgi:aminoglycoside phosphotransferase (APT) family kinase protein
MGLPEMRDADQARKDLGAWLETKVDADGPVVVSEFDVSGGTGFSNETLIFDAGWTDAGSGEQVTEGLVVRVEPTGFKVFLEADFESQWRVMQTLDEHTDLPMPAMRWYEPDPSILGSAFIVMGKVAGRAPTDNPPYATGGWLFDAAPEQQRTMCEDGIEVLARLHDVDWQALGLGFLSKPERGALGLSQQLDYYRDYLEWAAAGQHQPIATLALEHLEQHRPPELAEGVEDIRLSWGDSRQGNMLWDEDFRCVAVLDWEMVTLGHPAADLAWWLFLERYHFEGTGVPPLPGFPTREQTIARYEEKSGIRVAHLVDYYEILAGFRFAVVMMRLTTTLAEYDVIPKDSDMATVNPVTRLLADLLDVPQPDDPHWQQT